MKLRSSHEQSHNRSASLIYLVLFFTLIWPFWIKGEVVAPHRQLSELAVVDQTGSKHLENRKFSDFTNSYIPEISEHLNGHRSGWLALWTDKNELGRPLYQISGFSPAYFLSWIITHVTHNPYRFITILSLLTCFLAGIFVILFCRESGLHPLAGLIAGTSLAASPLFMYWLTFPMFPAVWCWSAGALWAVTRLDKTPDLLCWSALAFSVYSLLMTAYPQPVVYHAYLLGGYILYLAYRKLQISTSETARFLVLVASALATGVALTFPVYRDLAIIFAESARIASDPSFFTVVLPKFASLTEAVRFFVLSTVPELFGNPITPSFPFPYDGLSVTLVVIFFAVIGLISTFKKTWGWWLAIVVLCLLAFIHSLYELGVKYLGFNLSRSTPIGSIMLPLTVIAAFGVDALAKLSNLRDRVRVTMLAASCGVAIIVVGLIYGLSHGIPIRWGMMTTMLFVMGLLAAQYNKTRPVLLILALATVLGTISYPLMLRQDPAHIATTSPLVEKVKENLPAGSCFAAATPGIAVFPPNMNAGIGLASVHSYNSLSSKRYHTLIKALGGEVHTYGRWNAAIQPDFSSAMFWMSNISLILSANKIIHENLESLGEKSGIHLYRVISRMGDSLQVTVPQLDMGAETLTIADPRALARHSPVKHVDEGDVLEFEVTSGAPSLLILSQKFHRDWQALALNQQGWHPVHTTEINGIFQGVLLPPDIRRVRLDFKPLACYAWIAHVFWLLLLALLGFKTWQKSQHSPL